MRAGQLSVGDALVPSLREERDDRLGGRFIGWLLPRRLALILPGPVHWGPGDADVPLCIASAGVEPLGARSGGMGHPVRSAVVPCLGGETEAVDRLLCKPGLHGDVAEVAQGWRPRGVRQGPEPHAGPLFAVALGDRGRRSGRPSAASHCSAARLPQRGVPGASRGGARGCRGGARRRA